VGSRYITEETYDQYARYVQRWKREGRPEPVAWLPRLTVLELPALPPGNLLADPCHVLLARPRRGLADRVGSTPDGTRHDASAVEHFAHDLAGSAPLALTGDGHHVEPANTNTVPPGKDYVALARTGPSPPGDQCPTGASDPNGPTAAARER